MNVIIPLCGKGERFASKGYTEPKPLIKVFGKEIIRYTIDSLCLHTDDKIYVVITKHLFDCGLETFLKKCYDVEVIVLETGTRGAAETAQKAASYISNNRPCLLVDGDNFYTCDIISAIRENPDVNAIVCFETHDELPIFSYVNIIDDRIVEIAEKRKISQYANTGAYYFTSLDFMKKACESACKTVTAEPYISHAIATTLVEFVWRPIVIPKKSYFSLGTPEQVSSYQSRTFGYLFDLDGTLVYTDDAYFKVWSDILKSFNISLTNDIYDTYIFSNSDTSVKTKLLSNVNITVEELTAKKEALFLEYIHSIKNVKGSIEFVKRLQSDAQKIAVVTNANRGSATAILKHIGIDPDILVIGSECSEGKPSPHPYLTAMRMLGLIPDKCFVFEDSLNGITSARSANVRCIVGISTTYCDADVVYADFSFNYEELFEVKRPINDYKSIVINSLKNKYSISNVEINPIQLKGGFIADVLALSMTLNEKDVNAVIKIMNENNSPLNKMSHFLDLYGRENYFYESIAPYVPVSVPKCYGLLRDSEYKPIGFILEDMRPHAVLNRCLSKEPLELSLSVVSHMAKLHATFWDKDLDSHFPLLRKHNHPMYKPAWGKYVEERIDIFFSKWNMLLTPKHVAFARKIVGDFSNIQDRLSTGSLTLCHGDIKSPNIFYKSDEPCFIDWQYIAHGKGVQDLVFFMIESFSKDKLPLLFPVLKHYYYLKLIEYGVKDYAFSQYENDIEDAMCYFPFFVALWFGTTPNSDLIDVNFPFFFIQRLFSFYDIAGFQI